eukprot:scaffold7908_cov63-Phaeocystis_antarctica.AAC.3
MSFVTRCRIKVAAAHSALARPRGRPVVTTRARCVRGAFARRTRLLEDQSWGALTLEVGKSPTTEVPPGRRLPVAPPSAISSSFRRRALADPPTLLQLCGSRDGCQHGEQYQGARDRPALGACATRPGHAVNMLTDERRSARHPGAASMQLHGTVHHARHTAGCSRLPEPQSSQILRHA